MYEPEKRPECLPEVYLMLGRPMRFCLCVLLCLLVDNRT